jgi:hypothetical protein
MLSRDILGALKPELDALVAAMQVEPDERPAVANAGMALIDASKRTLEEHNLDWSPDQTLAAVQAASVGAHEREYAAAVATIRDYFVWCRGERAKLN